MKHPPTELLICQTCEELFDDGKYYVSTLDYNALKSSHDELLEATKLGKLLAETCISQGFNGESTIKVLNKLDQAIKKAES